MITNLNKTENSSCCGSCLSDTQLFKTRITIVVVKTMDKADQFEKILRPPAEKGSDQYTQWLSKLWKETAKLRNQDVRRFLNPLRVHLEVMYKRLNKKEYICKVKAFEDHLKILCRLSLNEYVKSAL